MGRDAMAKYVAAFGPKYSRQTHQIQTQSGGPWWSPPPLVILDSVISLQCVPNAELHLPAREDIVWLERIWLPGILIARFAVIRASGRLKAPEL